MAIAGQITGLICNLLLPLHIYIADQEDDGQRNYLLRSNQIPPKVCVADKPVVASNHNDIFIALNTKAEDKLGEEGEWITAVIDAECFQVFGVDEAMTELTNRWISYRSWLCDATKLIILKEGQPPKVIDLILWEQKNDEPKSVPLEQVQDGK